MLYKKTVVFLLMIVSTTLLMAEHTQRHQIVDNISVYFGAIPAQMIGGHGSMHYPENRKIGKHTYHILVSLFDEKSGERITDASVKATVIPLGMKGKTKKLEPMHGEVVSYGNFFKMPERTPYTIQVEIVPEKSSKKSIAVFTFTRPRD